MKRIVILLLFTFVPLPAYALEVQEVRWGFDGSVPPGRFSPLSVLLTNQSQSPFEGTLSLYKSDALGIRRGARLVRACFISPFSSRWVQFYPYVSEEREKWVLNWGNGRKGMVEIPKPRLGAPARVFLSDPDNPFGQPAKLKSFPENLFPPTVTATDGLYSVVLDHAPRWEPVRREAFLDWLRRGGIVHILRGGDGEYPEFPADLSVLNNPLDDYRVVAGRVVRHPVTRREVSKSALQRKGFAVPQLNSSTDWRGIGSLEEEFLQSLGGMAQPEHSWWLIYLIVVVYLVVVGPVNFLFGRKRRNYWLTILFFLAAVFCFGYTLGVVGRRGYGEKALVHTISYARPVSEGTYDVTQWTNAFVTSGAYYEVAHPSPHNLYATCQSFETVKGVIRNGRGGKFVVDIPMYSSRAFHHRGKMKGHNIKLEVLRWEDKEEFKHFSFRAGPGFPKKKILMWVLHGGMIYMLKWQDELLTTGRCVFGTPVSDFLSSGRLGRIRYYGRRRERRRDLMGLGWFARLLIARSIGGTEAFQQYVDFPPPPDDRLAVFIYARSPEGFQLRETGFGKEIGYVLYHVDVFRPQPGKDTNGQEK